MHYLGHNGADRLNLRIARAKRDPPDDIIEQMRNEAQFLNDRAVDQRNVADAAEPLFASLDDKQKAIFIEEMVRLSRRARARLKRDDFRLNWSIRGLSATLGERSIWVANRVRARPHRPRSQARGAPALVALVALVARSMPRIAGRAGPWGRLKARHPAILPQRRGAPTRHAKLKKR